MRWFHTLTETFKSYTLCRNYYYFPTLHTSTLHALDMTEVIILSA